MNNEYEFYMTVGDLKKQLKGIPNNTPVYYQRIEDWYFDDDIGSWNTKTLNWDFDMTTEGIRAFGSYHDIENKSFLIHAHY
jgi:hypothetical protein